MNTLTYLPDLLSPERCAALLAELERRGFQPTGAAYPPGYRNNDRLVFDDLELARELWASAAPHLPRELTRDGVRWTAAGFNPRFRACRYANGQQFTIHRDGAHAAAPDERSWLTFQIYVNDGNEFEGGRTRFYGDRSGRTLWAAVTPRAGSAIVFDHRAWHDGEAVTRGRKLVLRTDVMCRAVQPRDAPAAGEGQVITRHAGYVWRALELADGTVASTGRDGVLRLTDPRATGASRAHDLGRGSITALAEGPDGRLWCGTRSGAVLAFDRGAHPAPHDATPRPAAHDAGAAVLDLLALDGRAFAALATGEVLCLDGQARPLWRRPAHAGWAWALALHGGAAVSAGEDGALVAFDPGGASRVLARAGAPLRALASLPAFAAPAAAHPPLADLVLAGGADGVVRAYAGSELAWSVQAHDAPCTALDARGGAWASGGEDDRAHLWTGRARVRSWTAGDFVRSVRFTRAGDLLRAGYDGAVCIVALVSPEADTNGGPE